MTDRPRRARAPGSTRDRLVEAATELMWQHGIGEVSVELILAKAGALKGSFYHFFPSRVDILLECLDGIWRDQSLALTEIYAHSTTPQEGLRRHLEMIAGVQVEARKQLGFVPGNFNMSMPNSLLREDPRVTGKLRELMDSHRRHIELALERIAAIQRLRRPVNETARLLGYAISGAILVARMENSLEPLEDMQAILEQAIGPTK